MKNTLYIAVPCYNEEEVLPGAAETLGAKLRELAAAGKVAPESRILFIDDGSTDKTWELIKALSQRDSVFTGIALSRNRGHQTALLAGLMYARDRADLVVSLDADLQDDVNAIDRMIDEFISGFDIVYGVRREREKDTFLKRFTAETYYKLLRALGCDIIFNHADFRLLSRRALAALSEYRERDLFLRGIVPQLGFPSTVVTYIREKRLAGESKYTVGKMLRLASDGVFSLSLTPIRVILALGALLSLAAVVFLLLFILGVYPELSPFFTLISGGIVTMSIGIAGEYSGRAYLEAKRRPRWFIKETTEIGDEEV
jgi:glycosyltransferase involved in cell wall biosynthesis